jgi:glycosyltransferase involved in cell wall biosynthesis
MNLAHLTASPFFGGPERQMLGLARHLPAAVRSLFLSFREGGRCHEFLSATGREGFEARALENDTPHLRAAVRELAGLLSREGAEVLFCHGYKANLVGRPAARRLGIPAVAVSRGWTGESWKVRAYEALDRAHLRWMDRVVCVSAAQAAKVYRAGVRPNRIRVIHNAVDPSRFADPDPRGREELEDLFAERRSLIIGAAGRLSPEKGFDVLVAAAARVRRRHPDAGVVLFGEGRCRERLERRIAAEGLTNSVVLGGFRTDLDRLLPHFDLLVLPSYTEGLPNVVLEACAAGVPVVATAVGGTPEVLGAGGVLVPPGDPVALAAGIEAALGRGAGLRDVGEQGRRHVAQHFSFAAQARRYLTLLGELLPRRVEPEGKAWRDAARERIPKATTCEVWG